MAEQAGQQLVIAFVGTPGRLVAEDAGDGAGLFRAQLCDHGFVIMETFSEAVAVTMNEHPPPLVQAGLSWLDRRIGCRLPHYPRNPVYFLQGLSHYSIHI